MTNSTTSAAAIEFVVAAPCNALTMLMCCAGRLAYFETALLPRSGAT